MYGVAMLSRLLARGGEAHRAEAAARHQGRSKWGGAGLEGGHLGGYLV